MVVEQRFESREAASIAAAECMSGLIRGKLDDTGVAMFVVSGGSTPAQCFAALSRMPLDWGSTSVALSDERWVPNDHADSNERLIRDTLLTNAASEASVLPVYRDGISAEKRCDDLQQCRPKSGFACSLVGMGSDGHFASLFPDAGGLAEGLSQGTEKFYMPVTTAASPHPRISMTLAALLQSELLLLLFFGEDKYAVYERAKTGDKEFPVAHLLQQDTVDINVYWAP
ncbi:MAG: 6-phosphogluconolactonase [Gammaproteobacteria bacterium]|nr:6-phosphogluconolactonase [Gammaproteobacteria bacterium]